MGVTVDVSEVLVLARDLEAAGLKLAAGMRPVVSKGALNVKTQMRAEMGGSGSFGMIAPLISYDLRGNAVISEAEIGPEARGAGYLENIAYFGGAHGGGGTVPDPQGALDAEAPRFESALADLVNGLL